MNPEEEEEHIIETTEEHLDYFIARCKEWITEFGLKGWMFRYCHEDFRDIYTVAKIIWGREDRVVLVMLNKKIAHEQKSGSMEILLNTYAFHEVMHLLLSGLDDMARCDYGHPERIVNEEIHKVIQTIENSSLFENLSKDIEEAK